MALSQHQLVLIQQSFKKVAPIADQAAEIFYAKLFSYDPSLKRLFKGDMKSQGKKLMATLGTAVAALNNLDKLVPVLENLAIKHLDYGVKIDDYTPVGNALLCTLKQGLGDAFTAETREAWVTLFKLVADVMRSAAYPQYNNKTYVNRKVYNK